MDRNQLRQLLLAEIDSILNGPWLLSLSMSKQMKQILAATYDVIRDDDGTLLDKILAGVKKQP